MLRASAHEPRSGPPAPRTIAAWTSSLCRKAQRTNKRFAIEARTQASPLETATEGQPRRDLAGAARPEAAPACPAESPGSHSLSQSPSTASAASCEVQCPHRFAATGITIAHCGHSLVAGAAGTAAGSGVITYL